MVTGEGNGQKLDRGAERDDNDWRNRFVGRDDVLKELQGVYSQVTNVDKDGFHKPQLRVLLGLTGIGKTRIVQELYRWLASQSKRGPSAGDYWPDTLFSAESDGTNPVFELSEDRPWVEIPHLWWGLKFEKNNPSGRALYMALEQLPVHTTSAMAKRLADDQFWENVTRLGGLGVDLLFGRSKQVIDLLIEMRKVVVSRNERLKREREAHERIADQHQRERERLADRAMEMLRQFLDKTDTAAPTIPVVLFLDDAQWIDPVSMQFVSKLWRTAVSQRWPLFVVATHWPDDWNLFEAGDFERSQNRQGDENETKAAPNNLVEFFNELPPASRKCVDTIEILGVDSNDMETLVSRALPGLTKEQVQLLLDKARAGHCKQGDPVVHRCNARVVQQVLSVLLNEKKRHDYFVDGNTNGQLTETACEWIRNEIDRFDEEGIVRKLFDDFEADVQKALGWSSLQGRRFLAEVTEEVAKKFANSSDAEAVTKGLKTAENLNLWVERIREPDGHPARFNLLAFRQRAFQEIAAQHFTDMEDTRDAVDLVVSEILRNWLQEGRLKVPSVGFSQNKAGVTREELRDLLAMAIHRFDSTDDATGLDEDRWGVAGRHADARLCGLASASLAYLNASDGLWDQAESSAIKFADVYPQGCSGEEIDFNLQIEVIDLLYDAKEFDRAWALSNALVSQVKQSLEKMPKLSDAKSVARVLQRRGDCERQQEDWEAAASTYRELTTLIQDWQYHSDDAFSKWAKNSRTIALRRLASLEVDSGNLKRARNLYVDCLQIDREIAENDGSSRRNLRNISLTLIKLGRVQLLIGNPDEGLDSFREALKIRREIETELGASRQSQLDVSSCLASIGDAHMRLDARSQALEHFREALDIVEETDLHFGESRQGLRLARHLRKKIGDVGSPTRETNEQSLANSVKLEFTAEDESEESIGNDLIGGNFAELLKIMHSYEARIRLGELRVKSWADEEKFDELSKQKKDSVRAFFRRPSLGSLVSLFKAVRAELKHNEEVGVSLGMRRWWDPRQSWNDLIVIFLGIEKFLENRRKVARARCQEAKNERVYGNLEKSLELFREAIRLSPSFGPAHQGIAWHLAFEQDASGETLAEAKHHALEASGAEKFQTTLGLVNYRLGEWSDAARHLQYEVILGKAGPETWLLLAMAEWEQGDQTRSEGWLAKAAAENDADPLTGDQQVLFVEAYLFIGEQMVEHFGKNAKSLTLLSTALRHAGELDQKEGRLEEAKAAFERSVEIAEQVVEQFGETPQNLYSLSVALSRLGDFDEHEGRLNDAASSFERSLELTENAVEKFGETPAGLQCFCLVVNRVGGIQRYYGNKEKAKLAFRLSVEIAEQLVNQFEATPQNVRMLSDALNRAADFEEKEGNLEEAKIAFQRVIELNEQIVEESGETPNRQSAVGVALTRVGKIDLKAGRPKEAKVAFRRSLEVHRKIVDQFGKTPQRLTDSGYAVIYLNIARIKGLIKGPRDWIGRLMRRLGRWWRND